MGMLLDRARRAAEPKRPPRPPITITWAEHQEALGTMQREYELKLSVMRKAGTVEASVDSELVAQLEKATAFLSTAASENEALMARVVELENELDDFVEQADLETATFVERVAELEGQLSERSDTADEAAPDEVESLSVGEVSESDDADAEPADDEAASESEVE